MSRLAVWSTLVLLSTLTVGSSAGSAPTPLPSPVPGLLEITVMGAFKDAVLRDPRGRLNAITAAGRESTFAGCWRSDTPELPGYPEGADYLRFAVEAPLDGKYCVTVVARDTGWVKVDISGDFGRASAVDAGSVQVKSGDRVKCCVAVGLPSPTAGTRFSTKLSMLRVFGPKTHRQK